MCFKSVIKLFVLLPLLFVVLTPSHLSAFDVSSASVTYHTYVYALFYIYSKIRREESEVPNSRPATITYSFSFLISIEKLQLRSINYTLS